MIVRELMTASVNTVSEDTAIGDVMRIMKRENVGIVPVCDNLRHVLGVITDRDIIIREGLNKKAGEVMTSPAFCVSSSEDIHSAALIMSEHGVRRLPVTENHQLVGILCLKDLASRKIFAAEIGHIVYSISNYSSDL